MVYPTWVDSDAPFQPFQDCFTVIGFDLEDSILGLRPRLDITPVFLSGDFYHVGMVGGEVQESEESEE
jgi:hypothetical protein